MPESMTLTALTQDLKLALKDSTKVFDDTESSEQKQNYRRLIKTAIADMSRIVPCIRQGTLELIADEQFYDAPAGILIIKASHWGLPERERLQPWQPGYPRSLPVAVLEQSETTKIRLSPAPTASQIANLGSRYPYSYACQHSWADDGTTSLPEQYRESLLLRALAEAMRTIAIAKVSRNTSVKTSVGGVRQGEPSVLYMELMKEWRATG